MFFEIIGAVSGVEIIAQGDSVRSRQALNKRYGVGKWRKLKGRARVRLKNGNERIAEVHWYEAHGIGKKDHKIKRFVD
jgi:hypothetical protein